MNIHILLLFSFTYLALTEKNDRIIGGGTAYVAQYPFMAAIYKSTSDGQYFCGGTLLNQRWVLTAGQCVDNAVLFTIYLGTNNIKNISTTGIKLATDYYVLHPDFNSLTLENDIGLIKLRQEITYTDNIKPVTLATYDASVADNYAQLTAVGWGQISDETSELADELQYVEVKILSNEQCKLTYGNQIKDTMLCAAGNYNQGTCHGDTGTPIMYNYKDGRFQHGIASFVSAKGCESTDPSGYTRIYPYLTWIKNITSSEEMYVSVEKS